MIFLLLPKGQPYEREQGGPTAPATRSLSLARRIVTRRAETLARQAQRVKPGPQCGRALLLVVHLSLAHPHFASKCVRQEGGSLAANRLNLSRFPASCWLLR